MPHSLDPATVLEQMVRFPSPSRRERGFAVHVQEVMSSLGYHAFVDEVGNVVGVRGEGPRELMLLGHMDTAPGQIPVRWEGSRLYGRGAVDAKGSLAAFVFAGSRAVIPDGARLVIVGAVEEEAATSKGARHLLRRPAPSAVVVGEPSGWDCLTIGYKGRLLVRYSLRRPCAHSASGEPTVAEEALGFWGWVKGFAEAYNGGIERQFDRLDISLRAINTRSDGLWDSVSMEVALRLPAGFEVASFRQAARAAAGSASLRFSAEEQAFRAPKNTPLVRAFLRAIREQGGEPRFSVKSGTSDMNVVGPAWRCPILAYGPGDSRLDHTPEEHIELEEYLRSIEVLTRAIELYFAGPS
jgi:LysW-gamma-L-lysine carboxypeptidase